MFDPEAGSVTTTTPRTMVTTCLTVMFPPLCCACLRGALRYSSNFCCFLRHSRSKCRITFIESYYSLFRTSFVVLYRFSLYMLLCKISFRCRLTHAAATPVPLFPCAAPSLLLGGAAGPPRRRGRAGGRLRGAVQPHVRAGGRRLRTGGRAWAGGRRGGGAGGAPGRGGSAGGGLRRAVQPHCRRRRPAGSGSCAGRAGRHQG